MSTLRTNRTEDTFTGRRVTIKTTRSFDDVTARLYASIGTLGDAGWPSITSYLEGPSPTKEGFAAASKRFIGPEMFMLFWEIDHSLWTPLYGIAPKRRIKRVIVGNPMSAATVLVHELKAGLAAPAEMLILEGEDSVGTEVVFQLFSTLAAGVERDEGLLQASLNLDDKIQRLVDHITT
ncbi:hypothetical protein OIDMADRAFT_60877 [Oidiodendron maius Zn]|uniref:DUF302 domain-containing protein n=1 Tax=Oidiodendron maius (strain Zn) TaxID=913774 RepID=A0A0C3GD06_OIDMZ|nr:hypothetical protein OIDMADRAFT_60877 [Oidiodendron maius Zn]